MNKIITTITGRLTKDIEVKRTSDDKYTIGEYSVACDKCVRRANGQMETLYIKVTDWNTGRLREIAPKLKKGALVSVTGTVILKEYEACDKKIKTSVGLTALNTNVLSLALSGAHDDNQDVTLVSDASPF